MSSFNAGSEGFKWFLGEVVDIKDPLKLGRVRVKMFQEHDDKFETSDLHWAVIMMPPTSASTGGVGVSPTGITKGSMCMGFFMDANSKQMPVVMGTWHGMPNMDPNKSDVTALATGKQILNKEKLGPEPESSYEAAYPHNKVHYTESGHAIEIDDTPGKERLHVYHKTGTYVEINNDGRVVIKSVDESHEIVAKNKEVYVKGNCNIQVDGNLNVVAKGNAVIASEKNMTLASKGTMSIFGQGGVRIRSGADIAMAAPGGASVTEGSLSVTGSISSGTGVTGSFTTPSGKTVHVSKGIVSNIT